MLSAYAGAPVGEDEPPSEIGRPRACARSSPNLLPRPHRLKPKGPRLASVVTPATAGDAPTVTAEGNDAAAWRSARGGAADRLRVRSSPADLRRRQMPAVGARVRPRGTEPPALLFDRLEPNFDRVVMHRRPGAATIGAASKCDAGGCPHPHTWTLAAERRPSTRKGLTAAAMRPLAPNPVCGWGLPTPPPQVELYQPSPFPPYACLFQLPAQRRRP